MITIINEFDVFPFFHKSIFCGTNGYNESKTGFNKVFILKLELELSV